jgi:cytochrome o ubiquinol oxidase subunit 2
MCIVVIPVIILNFIFAFKYRASNTKAKYNPTWAHSTILEAGWWGIPIAIIIVLATMAWRTSHSLDPYRPLDVKGTPVVIQAVALNWKWLFIYPDQHIATVNYVQIPVNVPIRFLITSDGPMNAFQIPQLGTQIYAMAGMQTKLNVIADTEGVYRGFSANISGVGFSGMHFDVRAGSQQEFDQWVKMVRRSPDKMTLADYDLLAKPSENNPVHYYSHVEDKLFNTVIMRFMMPMKDSQTMQDMPAKSN